MRITRETLLKLARDTVKTRVQRDRGILCVYLTGSLVHDDPLLGGVTDIDLIFVHDREPVVEREITRLSDEVHFDIAHYGQELFHQPRHLRVSPWVGPFLCGQALALHDSQHWFEFTQASVCAQFNQPENVLERAQTFGIEARQIWMDLHLGNTEGETRRALDYLRALERAANTVASFSGPPLTERRMFLQIAKRAQAAGRPGMADGLVDLLSENDVPLEVWQSWQPAWNAALEAAGRLEDVPPRLNPLRKYYYTRAANALWENDPPSSVWIALRTWSHALDILGENGPEMDTWRSALTRTGLNQERLPDRLAALDQYLDSVEEMLDQWAREYGIESRI